MICTFLETFIVDIDKKKIVSINNILKIDRRLEWAIPAHKFCQKSKTNFVGETDQLTPENTAWLSNSMVKGELTAGERKSKTIFVCVGLCLKISRKQVFHIKHVICSANITETFSRSLFILAHDEAC